MRGLDQQDRSVCAPGEGKADTAADVSNGTQDGTQEFAKLGLVVIGRNEGQRLGRCLASLRGIPNVIYVDSGSTDGSVELAHKFGTFVMELCTPPLYTAARARNEGLAKLLSIDPNLEFVQMIDGDCEVQPGWLKAALASLKADEGLAAVFGRVRERNPEQSIYKSLCDDEWNVPVGEASGCGGNTCFRIMALKQVGLFNISLIAGEEPELAMRMREAGWRLLRIDREMMIHDIAITRFRQWWDRTRRSGHAYAEVSHMHPNIRISDWPRTARSIVAWGGVAPVMFLISVAFAITMDHWWWALAVLLIILWPLKMVQIALRQRRRGLPIKVAIASGVFLMIGKFPQFLGLMSYHRSRLWGKPSQLIEYR